MVLKKLFLTMLAVLCYAILCFGQAPLKSGEYFATANQIKIHYYVSGKGPVCLVPSPGWGPSVEYLRNSLQPFEKYFTMVYYDTRASGKSSGPDDPAKYTSTDFMNDMDSLRVYLKQPKVWIMGHSAGGFQVLFYGIHHNSNLYGIIALSAIAAQDSLYTKEYTKAVMKRKGQPYFDKGAAILLGTDTTRYKLAEAEGYILPFYFHDVKNAAKLPATDMSDKANDNTTVSKFYSEYLLPQLKAIKVPTLLVVGDDDFTCDKVSQSDRVAENMTGATEIVIKNAGHFTWLEQPGQFFEGCTNWLKKQGLKKQD